MSTCPYKSRPLALMTHKPQGAASSFVSLIIHCFRKLFWALFWAQPMLKGTLGRSSTPRWGQNGDESWSTLDVLWHPKLSDKCGWHVLWSSITLQFCFVRAHPCLCQVLDEGVIWGDSGHRIVIYAHDQMSRPFLGLSQLPLDLFGMLLGAAFLCSLAQVYTGE